MIKSFNKGNIFKVGTVTPNEIGGYNISNWGLDAMNRTPLFETLDNERTLIVGWDVEELKLLSQVYDQRN